MPTITVKLSKAEFARLEAMAAALKRTKSELVRKALAAAMHPEATSLLDAMRPYLGRISGPGDLSTNKARLKGYGRSRSR